MTAASQPDSSEEAAWPFSLDLCAPHLVVTWPRPQSILSWAIVGGGQLVADEVVWREVRNRDLPVDIDPVAFLQESLVAAGRPDAVGLMTSAPLVDYVVECDSVGGRRVGCVATVGLSNAVAVGDSVATVAAYEPGTINILVGVSHALTREAQIEAVSIAAEARTVAVCEAAVASRVSSRVASGTGTDCIVVASPLEGEPTEDRYAGKHTAVGAAIGRCVRQAVGRGIEKWRARSAQYE